MIRIAPSCWVVPVAPTAPVKVMLPPPAVSVSVFASVAALSSVLLKAIFPTPAPVVSVVAAPSVTAPNVIVVFVVVIVPARVVVLAVDVTPAVNVMLSAELSPSVTPAVFRNVTALVIVPPAFSATA